MKNSNDPRPDRLFVDSTIEGDVETVVVSTRPAEVAPELMPAEWLQAEDLDAEDVDPMWRLAALAWVAVFVLAVLLYWPLITREVLP